LLPSDDKVMLQTGNPDLRYDPGRDCEANRRTSVFLGEKAVPKRLFGQPNVTGKQLSL
jgi:hypothetical protein